MTIIFQIEWLLYQFSKLIPYENEKYYLVVIQGKNGELMVKKGQMLIFIVQIIRQNEGLNLRFSKELEQLRRIKYN